MRAIEIFSSWQGEGLYAGKLMTFVRFKACKVPFRNELCPWCDTKFKMKNSIDFEFKLDELESLLKNTLYKICFTGGEPTLYLNTIKEIFEKFKSKWNMIAIESNGYKLNEFCDLINSYDQKEIGNIPININYSPKFFTVEEADKCSNFLIEDNSFNKYSNNNREVSVKIPVSKNNEQLVKRYLNSLKCDSGYKWLTNMYLMPIGTNSAALSENMSIVMNLALEYNCNVSGRLHISHLFL